MRIAAQGWRTRRQPVSEATNTARDKSIPSKERRCSRATVSRATRGAPILKTAGSGRAVKNSHKRNQQRKDRRCLRQFSEVIDQGKQRMLEGLVRTRFPAHHA